MQVFKTVKNIALILAEVSFLAFICPDMAIENNKIYLKDLKGTVYPKLNMQSFSPASSATYSLFISVSAAEATEALKMSAGVHAHFLAWCCFLS